MKTLGKIPSHLFSYAQTASLKLKEQHYLILIPRRILQKYGIEDDEIYFNLVINERKLSLVGPSLPSPQVKQPGLEVTT